jgi:hypothetical protein
MVSVSNESLQNNDHHKFKNSVSQEVFPMQFASRYDFSVPNYTIGCVVVNVNEEEQVRPFR